jgi:hypothetical protein
MGTCSGFDSLKGRDFSVLHSVQTGSGTNLAPIQWLPGALPSRVKRPGREANHSPPSGAVGKNSGAIRPLPYTDLPLHGGVVPVASVKVFGGRVGGGIKVRTRDLCNAK